MQPLHKPIRWRLGGERNRVAHATACRAVGVNFILLVMESLGEWSEEAAATISRIGRLLGQRLGLPTSETTRHHFERCAISLWKGNANLWLRHLPFRSPFVDGYLGLFYILYFVLFYVLYSLFLLVYSFFVLCLCIAVALIFVLFFVLIFHFIYHLFVFSPISRGSFNYYFPKNQ